MPGTKIEQALNNVAEAVGNNDTAGAISAVGTMGIKGAVAQTIANMSAVGLIGLVMWVQFRDNAAQSKYDREMYRDEVKTMRESQEKRWEKTDTTHAKAMERMGDTVKSAVSSLEMAVKELKESNRRVKFANPPGDGGH